MLPGCVQILPCWMGSGPQFYHSGNAPKFSAPIFLVELEKTPYTSAEDHFGVGSNMSFGHFFVRKKSSSKSLGTQTEVLYRTTWSYQRGGLLIQLAGTLDGKMRCCRFHDLICFGEKIRQSFATIAPCVFSFFSAGDAFFFETTVFLMRFSVTLIWALRWTIGPSFLRCLGQLRDVGVRIHHFVTSKSLIPEAQDASLRVFKMFVFQQEA